MMYDNLVRFGTKMQIEPALAQSYEHSPDGRSWTFMLRPGLKWSDGQPLTADDVTFTLDTTPFIHNNPPNDTIHLSATLPAPGGSDSGQSLTDKITNVVVPVIDGFSEQTAFGNVVTINLIDETKTDATFGQVIGTGTTDAQGHFVWADLPDEPFQISMGKRDLASMDNIDVKPGGDPVKLTILPPVKISGKVIDAGNGRWATRRLVSGH